MPNRFANNILQMDTKRSRASSKVAKLLLKRGKAQDFHKKATGTANLGRKVLLLPSKGRLEEHLEAIRRIRLASPRGADPAHRRHRRRSELPAMRPGGGSRRSAARSFGRGSRRNRACHSCRECRAGSARCYSVICSARPPASPSRARDTPRATKSSRSADAFFFA